MEEKRTEKIELFAYVTPKTKEKLDCLKNLYGVAGMKFSFSRVIEDAIGVLYAAAYLSQKNIFWEMFFQLGNMFESEGVGEMIDKVLGVVKMKKLLTKEIMTVEIKVKDNFLEMLKSTFKKAFSKKAAE